MDIIYKETWQLWHGQELYFFSLPVSALRLGIFQRVIKQEERDTCQHEKDGGCHLCEWEWLHTVSDDPFLSHPCGVH